MMNDVTGRDESSKETRRMYDPLKGKAKVALYVTLAFLMGLGLASGMGWTDVSLAMPAVDESIQVDTDAVRPARELSDAFVEIADVVTPAVVRIRVVRPAQQIVMQNDIPEPFRRFFGPEGMPETEPQPQLSGGSGFIISDDGYILTNNHVVEGAEQITVYLTDRQYYEARIVGTDPLTDVAVIRIEPGHSLPTLSFGDSDNVNVGEWVLAVGNPGFSGSRPLDYTVTAGIISARGRVLDLIGQGLRRDGEEAANYAIEDFLQTDAVINPGNSGGPMVDLDGRVVGINSAIASQTGYYQGYGFAIPINLARRVMEDLIEYGQVRRPLLGVRIEDVSPEDAEVYGLPSVAGVLVQGITEGSPAGRAGIQPQDVIVAIDGRDVGYPSELQQQVAGYRPGDEVTVTLYRNGQRSDIDVVLGEAPINEMTVERPEPATGTEQRLGIEVAPLDENTARQLGIEDAQGVVITNVRPASPAFMQGVVPGLRVVAINGNEIETVGDVREALERVEPGQIVTLRLRQPDGMDRYENVRMPRN
jgi:serine protease Do